MNKPVSGYTRNVNMIYDIKSDNYFPVIDNKKPMFNNAGFNDT